MHPTLPYLLTCSDDMLIKLWDWDKGWAFTQVFEGHSHYVMQARQGSRALGRWLCCRRERAVRVVGWAATQALERQPPVTRVGTAGPLGL